MEILKECDSFKPPFGAQIQKAALAKYNKYKRAPILTGGRETRESPTVVSNRWPTIAAKKRKKMTKKSKGNPARITRLAGPPG